MMKLPEAGEIIDDTYEIRSVLGTGGFGAVYLARQINMDRDVALKLLVASGPKFEEMVKRFRREVMAIRNLTHPNTIRVYDFRDNPDGLLYYTMEALKGRNLKEEIAVTGPLSPRRLKRVLRQVLKSLSEAHSHGLVHRDLKPANIMIVEMHGETDFVKVLDFGIAKLMADGGEEGEDNLTSAGILVGTLRYMAPEQISAEYLGPQTDLYALGLIAVEMLSGASVFAGTGRWEVLRQQISEDPVPIPPEVRESRLGPIIEGCLRKHYRERFATAAEIIQELDKIPDSELSAEPFFVSDGRGGWISARESVDETTNLRIPRHDAKALDAMDTIVVDISEQIPAPEPMEEDKTLLTTVPVSPPLPTRPAAEATGPRPTVDPPVQSQERQPGLGMEASTEFPAFRGNPGISAQRRDNTDLTGQVMAPKKKGTNKPILAGLILLTLLFVGGGIYLLSSGNQEETNESGVVEERAQVPDQEEEPVGERSREIAIGSDDEVAEQETGHEIEVRTGGIRAQVFLDGELRGETPAAILVEDEPRTLRLSADGYRDEEITLSRDTPARLEVSLAQEAPEPTPEPTPEPVRPAAQPSSPSSVSTGASGTRERTDRAPRATTREERAPAPASREESDSGERGGWLEIEEEEDEIDIW